MALWEHRRWSSAIAIIWKAALQEQLARVHKGEERGSVHGKIRTLDNYMIHIVNISLKNVDAAYENSQSSKVHREMITSKLPFFFC